MRIPGAWLFGLLTLLSGSGCADPGEYDYCDANSACAEGLVCVKQPTICGGKPCDPPFFECRKPCDEEGFGCLSGCSCEERPVDALDGGQSRVCSCASTGP